MEKEVIVQKHCWSERVYLKTGLDENGSELYHPNANKHNSKISNGPIYVR